MGAYNIVNPAHLVAGQLEDVGDVLANLQAIQTVLNGGIDNSNINAAAAILASKLAGYPTDATKVLAGDGTWKGVPKITTSPWSGGPPAAPGDTDIWIATNVLSTTGDTWMFQYNANWVADAYKWLAINPVPVDAGYSQGTTSNSGTVVSCSTSGPFTKPIDRAGIYGSRIQASCQAPGVGTISIYLYWNGVNQYGYSQASWGAGAMVFGNPVMQAFTATSAGINAEFKYAANLAYTTTSFNWEFIPFRII